MSRRCCIGIAVLTLFTIIIVGSVIYVTSGHHPAAPAPQPPPKKTQPIFGPTSVSVEQACQATTDPYGCGATLSSPRSYPSDPPIYYAPTEILELATRICIRNVKVAQSVIANILKNATNDQKVSLLFFSYCNSFIFCQNVFGCNFFVLVSLVGFLPTVGSRMTDDFRKSCVVPSLLER